MALQAAKPRTSATPTTSARWQRVTAEPPKRRLIVMVKAREKQGKSHFTLTAPAPIFYQNFDNGLEGVIEKFAAKEIYRADYRLDVADPDDTKEVSKAADRNLTLWRDEYADAIHRGRTTVVDTGDELWELVRLAYLGKLTDLARNYGPLNREMREMVNIAMESGCNLIVPTKMKDEYVNDKRTGKSKAGGWGEMPYAAQVVVEAVKLPGPEFVLNIESCRQNPEIEGMTIPNDFITLAQMVYPDSKESEWL